MIRNMANARAYLKKIPGASNAAAGGQVESERCVVDAMPQYHSIAHPSILMRNCNSDLNSHIFDGENVHGNIGNYQLCDLTDPLLKNLIQDEEFVREECDVSCFSLRLKSNNFTCQAAGMLKQ